MGLFFFFLGVKTNLWGTYGTPDMTHAHGTRTCAHTHARTISIFKVRAMHTRTHTRTHAKARDGFFFARTGVMNFGDVCCSRRNIIKSAFSSLAVYEGVCVQAGPRWWVCVSREIIFRQMEGAVAPPAGSAGTS